VPEQEPAAEHHARATALAGAWPRFFRKLGATYNIGGAAGALTAAQALLGHGDAVEAALLVRERTAWEGACSVASMQCAAATLSQFGHGSSRRAL